MEFAMAIGLNEDYKNDLRAKKDVIDPSGDSHSVKGGKKKWQIFLYGKNRFCTDEIFQVMNGIGDLFVACIDSFPLSFDFYQKNKQKHKEKLRANMVALKEKLQVPKRLKALISKSMFNGGEVNYLVAKHNDMFHVFWGKEVIEVFTNNVDIVNSRARSSHQTPEQKVIFKYEGFNVGEIEMRNDSPIHYREIRFNMIKPKFMKLVFDNIDGKRKYSEFVYVYGVANKKFGRWKK
ncbi:hypothetical protein KKB40_00025 [Patescibacteria group bacterium]|nr:hypothetical protein [Patescibacteria group bacterium]